MTDGRQERAGSGPWSPVALACRACVWCGRSFAPKQVGHLYCTPKCSEAKRSDRRKAKRAPRHRRVAPRRDALSNVNEAGELLVGCWCERLYGYLPSGEVVAGATWACGPACYRGCRTWRAASPGRVRRGYPPPGRRYSMEAQDA